MKIPLRQYADLLGGYLRPQWRRVTLLVLLLLAGTALPLLNPLVLRSFIDRAVDGDPLQTLAAVAGLFIAIALLGQAVQVATTWVAETVGWTATNRLRADLVGHALALDMPFHNARTPGEMIERIDGDVTALTTFFSQFVVQILTSVLMMAGIVVVLVIVSLPVGLMMGAFMVVAVVTLVKTRNLAVGQTTAEREASAQLFGFLEERLQGLDDIRANGAGAYVMGRFYEKGREVYQTEQVAQKASAWIWMMTMAVFVLGYVLTLGMGAHLYLQGAVTIGTVYLFFQYMQTLRRPLELIAQQFNEFQKASAGVGRVQELRAIRSGIADGRGAGREGHHPIAVTFDRVTFTYHEGAPALSAIDLALAPGRVLGVLGRTGSGKTTLTRLVLRLWDVQGGAVRLDGVDVRDLRVDELRRRVGVVTQDVQLFAASVRDNLTLFDDSIADERIVGVLAELGLLDWLWSLPKGLDTELQSGGGGLSAGEAQLLAFARVFLRDPGLVILDEASSRLDPATERLIERAVDRLLAGRTGIVIAHRLGTVERADEILILEDGRIREYGARADLLRDDESRFAALLRTGMEEVLV